MNAYGLGRAGITLCGIGTVVWNIHGGLVLALREPDSLGSTTVLVLQSVMALFLIGLRHPLSRRFFGSPDEAPFRLPEPRTLFRVVLAVLGVWLLAIALPFALSTIVIGREPASAWPSNWPEPGNRAWITVACGFALMVVADRIAVLWSPIRQDGDA